MRLRVCTFSGASSLPIVIAHEVGIFEAAGLEVELTETKSSDALMTGLIDGTYQIVHAAPDNYVVWRDRTGTPIVAWIGGALGPLSLVGRPGTTSVSELRGASIAVDAPSSGFVSVLFKILRQVGIDANDVTLVPLGATHLRAAALRDGRTDATMLTLPWSAAAQRDGFPVLADGRAAAPRLPGVTGGSLATWLEVEPALADAYLRAIVAALTWLQMPGRQDQARQLIVRRYGLDEQLAEEVRAAFADPKTGWPPSALVDVGGLAAVCELRAENGQPAREAPEAYMTLEPYRRVLGFGLV